MTVLQIKGDLALTPTSPKAFGGALRIRVAVSDKRKVSIVVYIVCILVLYSTSTYIPTRYKTAAANSSKKQKVTLLFNCY